MAQSMIVQIISVSLFGARAPTRHFPNHREPCRVPFRLRDLDNTIRSHRCKRRTQKNWDVLAFVIHLILHKPVIVPTATKEASLRTNRCEHFCECLFAVIACKICTLRNFMYSRALNMLSELLSLEPVVRFQPNVDLGNPECLLLFVEVATYSTWSDPHRPAGLLWMMQQFCRFRFPLQFQVHKVWRRTKNHSYCKQPAKSCVLRECPRSYTARYVGRIPEAWNLQAQNQLTYCKWMNPRLQWWRQGQPARRHTAPLLQRERGVDAPGLILCYLDTLRAYPRCAGIDIAETMPIQYYIQAASATTCDHRVGSQRMGLLYVVALSRYARTSSCNVSSFFSSRVMLIWMRESNPRHPEYNRTMISYSVLWNYVQCLFTRSLTTRRSMRL